VTTIHASAVVVGARAVLIRGAAGSGKSQLALRLIEAPASLERPFARLVADDRVAVAEAYGRLMVSPPAALAGLIEIRGLGIRRIAYEPLAVVGLVVDLGDEAAERMPSRRKVEIASVTLPLLCLHPCADPLGVVLAALRTRDASMALP